MFDFLLGLSSIGCAIMDGLCIAEASRPAEKTEQKPEERYVPDLRNKRNYRVTKTKQQRLAEKYGKADREKKPEHKTESPLDEWLVANAELLLEIIENPGTHLIKKELLNEIDAESIADVLFNIPTIESVEVLSDGIEVVSR